MKANGEGGDMDSRVRRTRERHGVRRAGTNKALVPARASNRVAAKKSRTEQQEGILIRWRFDDE